MFLSLVGVVSFLAFYNSFMKLDQQTGMMSEREAGWVEAMGTGFVRYSLRQDLNKYTNEINRKFFRTARRVVEFDTTELERADTKSLFEAFRIAIGRAGEPGFMTTEEVRDRLNLKRKPDGDLNPGATNEPPAPPTGQ